MRNGIEHLDFYPETPEVISDLVEMHGRDVPQEETELQGVYSRREKAYVALLETTTGVAGASIGYLGCEAVHHSQNESSPTLPEISLGIVAYFAIAVAFAKGITRVWGEKTWDRIKAATSRD